MEWSGVDVEWKDVEYEGHRQEGDHPVINVSWEDAVAFCMWLTERERTAGRIGKADRYRLPTDVEWSYAVGIGGREDARKSPMEKDSKIVGYPWGTAWPPPDGKGNYSGQESARGYKMKGYRDGHAFTAPVGSYRANDFGLYDLSGNVREWCMDWHDPLLKGGRLVRGGSWKDNLDAYIHSSCRLWGMAISRFDDHGFRCVLEAGVGS